LRAGYKAVDWWIIGLAVDRGNNDNERAFSFVAHVISGRVFDLMLSRSKVRSVDGFCKYGDVLPGIVTVCWRLPVNLNGWISVLLLNFLVCWTVDSRGFVIGDSDGKNA